MEKAIIVGLGLEGDNEFFYSMEELKNLANACEIEVTDVVAQYLDSENPALYIGTGKAHEISDMVKRQGTDIVIFNDELSPSQIRNLEDIIDVTVIDRTYLILEIFSRRAKTKEAQLQVEIAQLKYMLPRLVGLRTSLGRQYGGGSGGTVNRGAGEKKLELDRRKIESRISLLNKELADLVLQRKNQRKKRTKNEIPVVAIVGYTNSGKSTLMNSIIELSGGRDEKKVFEKDMLFATLETTARKVAFSIGKEFLIIDTVGFVSKLPHYLVKAFRSTLEEITDADLLLHVVDASNSNLEEQKKITREVLSEIGVDLDIPEIVVYNKSDLLDIQRRVPETDSLFISAKSRDKVPNLIEMVEEKLFGDFVQCEFLLPFERGEIEGYFRENTKVLNVCYEGNGIRMIVECKEKDRSRFSEFLV